ncbi:MAG: N-acetyltransferase family protein [Acidobacteria bacterium]|nr:MAG: N-acetyltransferase family protein [Acidobacteriota bacterium]
MPTIRLATGADAPAIAAIYAPYCSRSIVSFEEIAPTADEMARRIGAIGAMRPWLVLEDAGQVIGYAYASPHHDRAAYRWSVSTAIYIGGRHHRRGAGRALYTALFGLLRHLGYYTATAGITLPNPASVGLHEAFGFTLVGVYRDIGHKMGAWHDVAWYQAPIQPAPPRPSDPRPITRLQGSPEWHDAVTRGLVCWKPAPAPDC